MSTSFTQANFQTFFITSGLSLSAQRPPHRLNVLLVQNDVNNSTLDAALNHHSLDFLKIQYGPLFVALVKDISPDAIVFNLDSPSEQLFADLNVLNRQRPLPIVMFVADGTTQMIDKAVKAEVSALIVNGLDGRRINSIIDVAMARFRQHQAMKGALEEARTLLEDRKQIDRAKAILIRTQSFTEDEAYHTLRKLAMDRGITIGEMARNVIAMAELLK